MEWKYQYLDAYSHQRLKDGDVFMVGNIKFQVMHTPGHTPESISFVLTDQGGGADKPMGIFTGDFVFVGSIGRPDLLEEAAGIAGTAEPGARDLFRSVARFKQLPDHLQVWPAHGAGSACGKGLGAIPSSTVGYEKLFNAALQFDNEDEFVRYILADQPEAPTYFALMKRVNKAGPRVLGESSLPEQLDPQRLAELADATVIDLSPPSEFAIGHVPHSINIPLSMLAAWAGWLIDYTKPVYLIGSPDQLAEATRVLQKIGLDTVAGFFDISAVRDATLASEGYRTATPDEVAEQIATGSVQLIDVRSVAEWHEGHIPKAEYHFLGRLPDTMYELQKNKPVVTQCRSGARSAIAASLLQAAGFGVINLSGGYRGWKASGLPSVRDDASDKTASALSR